jgi:hypothetical protein
MARAIGLEIKKCLISKATGEPCTDNMTEGKQESKVEDMEVKKEDKPGSSC